jgi:hypothetical protein
VLKLAPGNTTVSNSGSSTSLTYLMLNAAEALK